MAQPDPLATGEPGFVGRVSRPYPGQPGAEPSNRRMPRPELPLEDWAALPDAALVALGELQTQALDFAFMPSN